MSEAVLYATPEMNEVFGRVWGTDARQKVKMPDRLRHADAVTEFLRKMDSAYESSRHSKLVFG